MQVGQQVVCVDDHFATPLAKYYVSLPVKGKVYTIRALFVGRRMMHPIDGEVKTEIGLLLVELVNGKDPRHKDLQELGFNSERFRPLQHLDADMEEDAELVRVGSAPKVEPLKALPLPDSLALKKLGPSASGRRTSRKGYLPFRVSLFKIN
jgi:hypothetical protein